jgi:hypothetical protein
MNSNRLPSLLLTLLLPSLLLIACDGSGRVGLKPPVFDFTRIAADGSEYKGDGDFQKQPWSCVRDNKTGLMWEVKSAKPGLQAATNTYSWLNNDPASNGGDKGTASGGICSGSTCDTESYITAINKTRLCGYDDWRVPNRYEMATVLDYSIAYPGPTIASKFFPNTDPGNYWSSTPFGPHDAGVWAWRFDHGYDFVATKEKAHHVLAIRGTRLVPNQ